jgi:cytochrome b561
MTKQHYDIFTRILHWVMAIVIIYATIAGYAMHLVIDDYPDIFHFLSVVNMSLATIAMPIFIVRWLWKHMRETPDFPQVTHHKVAHLVHSLLYILMFSVFVSGFLMLKESYTWFWLFQIGNPITSFEINDFFFSIHRFSCMALGALVMLHATAALHHHWVKGNDVLYRMVGPSTR